MEDRNDLLERKLSELKAIIAAVCVLNGGTNEDAKQIMIELVKKGGIRITAPQEFAHSSNKPGNILINYRGFLRDLPKYTVGKRGFSAQNPIFLTTVFLELWKKVADIVTVDIGKSHAILVYALWNNCDEKQMISYENGYICFENLHIQVKDENCSDGTYSQLLKELEKLKVIKIYEDGIFMSEYVRNSYT